MSAAENALLAVRLLAVTPAALGGVAIRAHAGPARDAVLQALKGFLGPRPWRRLPLGVDDDRLLGGLDVVATLREGASVHRAGVLAEADGGVLIVPSAERVSPALAARIAAAMDQGGVRIERDGRSTWLPARFGLVLLDEGDGDERAPAALLERVAFHLDLREVRAADIEGVTAEPAPRDAPVQLRDGDVQALCATCDALAIGSARAPIFAIAAAKAHAVWDERDTVDDDDVAIAAALVLGPRAMRAPPEETHKAPPEPDPPPSDADSSADETPPPPLPDPALDDVVLAAAKAALPENLLAALASDSVRSGSSGQGAVKTSALRGRPIGARPGMPRNGARLALLDTLRAAAPWQAMRRNQKGSAAGLHLTRDDLRIRRFEERSETSVIFTVDASGSAAFQRLAEVKGAIELILAEAYVARTHVGLVTFRNHDAEILLSPTRSLARARAVLAGLPGGGPTPLAAGLDVGMTVALAERAKGRSVLLLVMTDGRANVTRDGVRDRARAGLEAMESAARIRAAGLQVIFVDTGRWPSAENQALAHALGGRYAPLPFADAASVQALART